MLRNRAPFRIRVVFRRARERRRRRRRDARDKQEKKNPKELSSNSGISNSRCLSAHQLKFTRSHAFATRDSRDQHAEKEKTRSIVTRGDRYRRVGMRYWCESKKKKRMIKLTRNEFYDFAKIFSKIL